LAEICAIADPEADAAMKAAENKPDALVGITFDEMLSLDLDGIVIATPSALHAEQALAALESNKAVFCQAPLAGSALELSKIINAAKSANRLLGVDQACRFTTGMRNIRELLQKRALGEVYAVEVIYHTGRPPERAWRRDSQAKPGGCLLDLGSEVLDLTLWALNYPKAESISAQLRRDGKVVTMQDPGGEDYAAVQLQLESGVSLQLACSWKAPSVANARIELNFFGTHGGARFHNVNGSRVDFAADHFRLDHTQKTLATTADLWEGRAALEWTKQLTRSSAFDPQIEQCTIVAETIDRIYGKIG
jgi:predicted dehydrogenase